ncbi:hypothetical protein KC331_g2062 [Hortaea werneckii]|uniref:Uncharacterized protein n=1 Tax=Hortaea werneckii TaxID=91943 RepID=A0A3M7CUA2_HORWE|nr:hypothetical protein KC331_g2062 [Hortaea werneckii]KAI7706840.1 hypothetical protein KC353_g12008 [Hortaea werneckii]RMY55681.1 hypothetical protein D0865_04038 [Hortaea werneckii]
MANGTATSRGGSDDRPSSIQPRRKTVSGAMRPCDHESDDDQATAMKLSWPSPSSSAPTSPTAPSAPTAPTSASSQKPSGHKRSFSGSILQKLNLLRHAPSQDASSLAKEALQRSPKREKSRPSIDDDDDDVTPKASRMASVKAEGAIPSALAQVKGRKRKGSLRKTALLGGRRITADGRERKNSLSVKSPLSKSSSQPQGAVDLTASPEEAKGYRSGSDERGLLSPEDARSSAKPLPAPRRQFSYESSTAPSSTESTWSGDAPAVTSTRLSLVTEAKAQQQIQSQTGNAAATKSTHELGSPLDLKSPVSQTSYTSTTDDDDVLTFDRPTVANTAFGTAPGYPKPLPQQSISYLEAPSSSHSSRRSTKKRHPERSPLSRTLSASSLHFPNEPESPHDYSTTATYGYAILVVTWLTFAVGMGSCLDLWSWAWDVGETPYAPPELEDDPTLPIVGYYPALMVLVAGVVGWGWCLVAWVGVKYFRHAKIEV